ncbi:MAG: hypothetical protein DCC54_05890 [Anaerolineae bacterium]|nr:MAG: hypothetical protein DCC54_05890 [Anaerolineae bacterium]
MKKKHIYTGKFEVGQTVYLNDHLSLAHGRSGVVTEINLSGITEINLSGRGYPYRVNFGVTHAYYPEEELSANPISKSQQTRNEL